MSIFDKISNAKPPTLSDSVFTQIGNAVSTTPTIKRDGGLGGIFKKFFEPEPDGRLRFRDVVREIPGESVRHAKGLSKFGREVLQGTARSGASAGLSLLGGINKIMGTQGGAQTPILEKPTEVKTFADAFQLVLFGDEDVESLGTRIERFPYRVSGFGESIGIDIDPTKAKPFAIPAVLGLTALDFTGGGGKNKVTELIAKTGKFEDIVNILKTQAKGLPEDSIVPLSKKLANITNPSAVDDLLRREITDIKNTSKFGDARMRTTSDGALTKMDGFTTKSSRQVLKKQGDEIAGEIDELIAQLENPNLNRQIDLNAIEELNDIKSKIVKGKDTALDQQRFFEIARLKVTEPDRVARIAEKERGFITTMKEAADTSPEVARKIAANYNPLSNDDILNTARDMINQDLNEAIRFAKDLETPATAQSNSVAQLLIQQAQNAGRWDDAIELVEITAKRATTQGQAIQALSMWNRLTPEGILRYSNKIVIDANKKLPVGKKIKMSDEFAKDLVDRARKIEKMADGEEKAFETAVMIAKIGELVPPSIGKKIATFQILAQLLNPKTLIRNIGGNTAFSMLENVTDVFSAAIDSPLSILTGRRSKVLPSLTTQLKGFSTGLKQGVRDAVHGIDTAGLPTKFDIPKTPVFKNPVGKGAEKLLNIVLRGPDRASYKAAYDGSIFNQTKAASKGRKGVGDVLEPTEAMKEIAHYDGLYRTFQDENVISNFFVGLKRTLNLGQDFGLGDIVIKYPRTPGNLLSRGLDYSPAGFVNTIYQASRPLMGRPFNQKEFVESFSRAIVGTGSLVGTGALLHRIGIITGEREKDKDIGAVQRVTGLGQYRINASAFKRFALSGMDTDSAKLQEGDKIYTYDWFQPLAIGISIGANIDDTHKQNQTTGQRSLGVAGTLIESVASGVNTLGEQPLVQNLTRILKFGTPSDAIIATLKQVPRSFIPTLLNQINQYVDNKQRNVYDPDVVREAYNSAKQRVPVFAGQLPPRISVFGEDLEVYQGGGNNLFNVFFNPSFKSVYTPTPEAELVLSLFEETGETKQAPRIVSKTAIVNGKKMKLGPKQITAMQRFVGTVTRNYFHQLANSPEFKAQAPEDQVKFMSNVLTDVGTAAKILLLGHRPKRNPSLRSQIIIRNYMQGNQILQEKIQEDLRALK